MVNNLIELKQKYVSSRPEFLDASSHLCKRVRRSVDWSGKKTFSFISEFH